MEEHKHDWYVVTEIKAVPWNTRMGKRLSEEEEKKEEICFWKSRTLICRYGDCMEIKVVE